MTQPPEVSEPGRPAAALDPVRDPWVARQLLEQLPARIWTTDERLIVTGLHGAGACGADVIGVDPVGKVAGSVFEPGASRDACMEAHRRAARGERTPYLMEQGGRAFRCVVEPLRDARGGVVGCIGVAQDVTELHRTMHELEESERRFRLLAESISDYFWIQQWEPDGSRRLTYISPSIEEFWGQPVDDPEGFNHVWNASIHPEDREGAIYAFSEGVQRGVNDHEYRMIRPDGQVRWVHDRAYPHRDASGRIVRVLGVTQDITERKRQQLLFESFVAETATLSGTALIEAVARQLSRAFGARWVCVSEIDPEDPSRGRSVLFLCDGRIGDAFRFPLDGSPCGSVVLEGQRYVESGLASMYPGSASFRELGADSYLGTPLLDGQGRRCGTVCLMHDATLPREAHLLSLLEVCAARVGTELIRMQAERQRAHAERALRESEARHRSLIEASPICIHEMDKNGRITSINTAGLRILGLKRAEEVIGKRKEDIVVEGDRARVEALMARALRGERVSFEAELITARGVRASISHYAPVLSEDGELLRLVGVTQDITARVEAERARRETEERLFQAQRVESLGLMAGGIAHDFSNLLMAIQGHLELARRALEPEHPAMSSLTRVEEAARQASGVTASLLSFTRGAPTARRAVELGAIVDHTTRMLRRTLPASIEFRVVACSPDGVWTLADESQLHQVVMNLALNARDAMPDGGLLEIIVQTDAESDEAVIIARDTGCGMDEKTRARACDPYFTTKARDMGTGLGLAVTCAIVHEHGGSLEIESEPGRGTSVTVRLPGHRPAARSVEAQPTGRVSYGAGRGALLCEDNPQVRSVLASMLQELGYEVHATETGHDAMAVGHGIDNLGLLVLDVDLPGVSGIETLKRLRALGSTAPAVVISGSQIEDADRLGPGSVVLRKPFMMRELDAAIAAATSSSTSVV